MWSAHIFCNAKKYVRILLIKDERINSSTASAMRAAVCALYCDMTTKCQCIPAQTHATSANNA